METNDSMAYVDKSLHLLFMPYNSLNIGDGAKWCITDI